MTKRINNHVFEVVGNLPAAWFGVADSLLKSSAALWPNRATIAGGIWVALLLRGFAVENLAKGLLIQRKDCVAKEGSLKLRPGLGQHDLQEIYVRLGFTCSGSRADMLKALSKAARFLGRYPIPLKSVEFPMHERNNPDPTGIWSRGYEVDFWKVVRELASKYEFLTKLPPRFLSDIQRTWKTTE